MARRRTKGRNRRHTRRRYRLGILDVIVLAAIACGGTWLLLTRFTSIRHEAVILLAGLAGGVMLRQLVYLPRHVRIGPVYIGLGRRGRRRW
jgi:hypothetical protein